MKNPPNLFLNPSASVDNLGKDGEEGLRVAAECRAKVITFLGQGYAGVAVNVHSQARYYEEVV